MAIHVLDQHTAELIAAGEVVERPASVIKELCENAIDAGAANIVVEIEKGGTKLMQVADDGGGIEAADIPLAFLRHATSKVRTQTDLDAITTLGFRGEALASIASVAQVQLLTKTEQDEFAGVYTIEGGREMGLEAAGRPVGTTITVKNLFYNTPARMKFLKKDASEGTYITETVTRLALSHPEIAWRYLRDGKQVFATPGDGKLESAVWTLLGKDFARDLIAVQGQSGQYVLRGLVTPPRAARASRAMQFFFINGRFVKNRTMMAALEQAYRGMMMQGRFPGGVLFLTMPPQLVDVNVHPAKTEVRFARESDIFDAVYKGVKSALLQSAASHNILAFDGAVDDEKIAAVQGGSIQEPAPAGKALPVQAGEGRHTLQQTNGITSGQHPATRGGPPQDAARIKAYNETVQTLASDSIFAPYEKGTENGIVARGTGVRFAERALDIQRGDTEPACDVAPDKMMAPGLPKSPMPQQVSLLPAQEETASLRFVGEIFKTYILAEWNGTLCVIDKHAAHERMIYEQLIAARSAPAAQQLLSPATVTLSAEEKNALLQNGDVLLAAGIEVEDFGGNGVLVRAVPADVQPDNVQNLIEEVAGRLAVNHKDALNEKTEWVLHSVACRAAMKAGDTTPPGQLLALAGQIMSGEIPPFCPHGRPVVLEITRKELEKQFGRLG